jgi:VanZ like protein
VNVPITVRLLVTIVLIAVIVALSVVPGRALPGDSAFVWLVSVTPAPLQKLMHVVAYATLALLWMWTLEKIGSLPLRIALAFTISVGIGAALEWYQLSVPGRFGTLTDALLNAAGATAGLIAAVFLL